MTSPGSAAPTTSPRSSSTGPPLCSGGTETEVSTTVPPRDDGATRVTCAFESVTTPAASTWVMQRPCPRLCGSAAAIASGEAANTRSPRACRDAERIVRMQPRGHGLRRHGERRLDVGVMPLHAAHRGAFADGECDAASGNRLSAQGPGGHAGSQRAPALRVSSRQPGCRRRRPGPGWTQQEESPPAIAATMTIPITRTARPSTAHPRTVGRRAARQRPAPRDRCRFICDSHPRFAADRHRAHVVHLLRKTRYARSISGRRMRRVLHPDRRRRARGLAIRGIVEVRALALSCAEAGR